MVDKLTKYYYPDNMTVEATRTRSKFGGLKHETTTRLLDFRAWDKKESAGITIVGNPETCMLQMGAVLAEKRKPGDKFVFLKSTSEDDVEVTSMTTLTEDGETVIFSREAINDQEFTTIYGEKISWRETLPGDYPPLEKDQVARPIQQKLGLA